jgi:hypothetical protein
MSTRRRCERFSSGRQRGVFRYGAGLPPARSALALDSAGRSGIGLGQFGAVGLSEQMGKRIGDIAEHHIGTYL